MGPEINLSESSWKENRKTEAIDSGIYLTIIDRAGTIGYTEIKNEQLKRVISEFAKNVSIQNFTDTIFIGGEDRQVFYLKKMKTGNNLICLYSPTGSSISVVFGLESGLLQIIAVGFLAFFIISGTVIYQIVGIPLREITMAAENFTEGKKPPDIVPAEYDDEVKDLAESFMRMTQRISSTIASLDETSFLYKAIVKNTPIIHFIVDEAGEVKLLDGKAISKISLRGNIGQHYSVVFSAYPELTDAITTGIKNGSLNTIVTVSELTFILSLFPLEDSKKNSGSFVGVCEDITDEAAQKKLLEEREALYRLQAENSTDIISLHDKNGRILYISPSCENILQNTPDELRGKLLSELIHTEDEPIYNVLINSIATKSERENFSYRLQRADKDYVWVESVVKKIAGNINDDFTIQMVTRDISERRKTIDLLISSEKRFRMVWEKSLDAFRITDKNGIMLDVNESFCRFVKIPRSELIGKPFYIIYNEQRFSVQQMMKDYRERFDNLEETTIVETELFLKNRDYVLVDLSIIILETERNNLVLFSVFRDVTEKRKSLNQLMMLSRAVQQSPAIVMITDLDEKIIYVNLAFERITQYEYYEAVGPKPKNSQEWFYTSICV